jgi:hypothetical protein
MILFFEDNVEQDIKAGRRVRGKMVDLLEDVMQKVQSVLSFAKYEDIEDVEEEPMETKARVKPFDRTPRVTAPSTGRVTPNWSAKVGETIIGNLIRGEGGKFASKRNITSMMNLLAEANISPDMFKAMQALLAGQQYTNQMVLDQLKEAGLVSDAGVPTGKANDIIRAIKTAKPENLKNVLKPSGGGGGGGGGRAAKPSAEEQEQQNVDKTGETVVGRGALSQDEFDAFMAFSNGEEIDAGMEAKLKQMGLINDNGSMSTEGKKFIEALKEGDTRAALDALANAKNEDTVTDKVAAISESLVKGGALSKAEADAFVKFAEGEKITDAQAESLVAKGLLAKAGEDYYLTGSSGLLGGRGLWKAMQDGKEREALDAVAKAKLVAEQAAEGEAEGVGEDGERFPETVRQNNIQAAANTLLEAKVITQDELGGLLNFVAGGNVSDEILEQLLSRGLVTKTPRGNYVRSDAGKRFLQALDAGDGESAMVALENKSFGLKLFEAKDGKTWLMTWTMNAFEDREEELFTTDSIQDYIKRFEDDEEKGTCQFWHIKGSDFATIRWQGGVGRFLVELSTFDDTPIGEWFKSFFKQYPNGHPVVAPYGWGCSHGFKYRSIDRLDGVYNWFEKKETTVLPIDAASNVFTLAEFRLGDKTMELSEKQRKALQVIGEEVGVFNFADIITETGKAYTKLLEDSGIRYKAKVTKTEGGVEYVASDFAYTPDKADPSTWKLRIAEDSSGNVTVKQLGRAAAAFSPGGFRGKKVKLPSDAVSGVKSKLRGAYSKLGVKREDMPEGIKALGEAMELKAIGKKLYELAESAEEEMKAELVDMGDAIIEEPEAVMRRLMELTAQIDDEEMRMEIEALVSLLSPELEAPAEEEPMEPEMEPMVEPMPAESVVGAEEEPVEGEPMEEMPEEAPVEEEMPADEEPVEEEAPAEEEPVEEEEEDEETVVDSTGKESTKQIVDAVVEALDLSGLQAVLESHRKQIDELSIKSEQLETYLEAAKNLNEQQAETIQRLENELESVKAQTEEIKREDEVKIAEKQIKSTPRWGAYQATRAASTVLQGEEKTLVKPKKKAPSTISSMSQHIIGGK